MPPLCLCTSDFTAVSYNRRFLDGYRPPIEPKAAPVARSLKLALKVQKRDKFRINEQVTIHYFEEECMEMFSVGNMFFKRACLSLTMVFSATLIGAVPVQAQTNLKLRASLLGEVGTFLKDDWAQTKDDFVSLKQFLKRDWERTRQDFRAIKDRMKRMQKSLMRSRVIDDKTWSRFREQALGLANQAIDEAGAENVGKMMHEHTKGKMGFSESAGNPELQRAKIRKSVVNMIGKMRTAVESLSKDNLEMALAKANQIVKEVKKGKTIDEVLAVRNTKASAPFFGGSFLSVGEKILCAALSIVVFAGVIGLPALGAFYLATGVLGATTTVGFGAAAGGAAVVFVGFIGAGNKVLDSLFNIFG